MWRSLLAILLALGVMILTVSLATASIEPPRKRPLTDRAVADPVPPDLPNMPCLVGPSAATTYTTTGRHDFGLAGQPGSYYLYAFGGFRRSVHRYDGREHHLRSGC
jgi:hypothetical protein